MDNIFNTSPACETQYDPVSLSITDYGLASIVLWFLPEDDSKYAKKWSIIQSNPTFVAAFTAVSTLKDYVSILSLAINSGFYTASCGSSDNSQINIELN